MIDFHWLSLLLFGLILLTFNFINSTCSALKSERNPIYSYSFSCCLSMFNKSTTFFVVYTLLLTTSHGVLQILNFYWLTGNSIYKQYPPFGAKICSDICNSFPRVKLEENCELRAVKKGSVSCELRVYSRIFPSSS